MAQLYLLEIFIDSVGVIPEEDETGGEKKLIIKVNFGPKAMFITKEGQPDVPKGSADNITEKEDITSCDNNEKRKYTRKIRIGRSYLFSSCADSMLLTLSKFPLEIEVWNDDINEEPIFVGIGNMIWDTAFYHMLKETENPRKIHEPLTIKQTVPLKAECCCKMAGDITFILRITALGDGIITEYQQLYYHADRFRFRTNKSPTLMESQRLVGENANFTMIGSLYETVTLEDPDVVNNANNMIEVCTDLESCGLSGKGVDERCHHPAEPKPKPKVHKVEKVRIGDITGPCGNANCALALKVKSYIKTLDAYKKGKDITKDTKDVCPKKLPCGTCNCPDDTWHREQCLQNKPTEKEEDPQSLINSAKSSKTGSEKTDPNA